MSTATPQQRTRNDSAFLWAMERLCGERPPTDIWESWFDDKGDERLLRWVSARVPESVDAIGVVILSEDLASETPSSAMIE